MILSYSKDRFVDLIKQGIKIHTIRHDQTNRWHVGMSIQHWRGNPRNVRQNPYHFATGECKGIQKIEIEYSDVIGMVVKIDGKQLFDHEIHELAINDGFDSARQFAMWFNEPFVGKIIHFTDFKYKL